MIFIFSIHSPNIVFGFDIVDNVFNSHHSFIIYWDDKESKPEDVYVVPDPVLVSDVIHK